MKKAIQTNTLTKEQKSSLLTRVISALVLCAISFPCFILGGWFFFALILLVTVLCSIELVKVVKLEGKLRNTVYVVTIFFVIFLTYYVFAKNFVVDLRNSTFDPSTFLYKDFDSLNLSPMLILLVGAAYFFIYFCTEKFSISTALYFFALAVIIPLGMQSFLYLRYIPFSQTLGFGSSLNTQDPRFLYGQSFTLLLYVLIGTFMNDMGAYFAGLLFGKNKVNTRISPKKTWEGFFGGIIVSIIFSVAFALILSFAGYPILPMFDHNHWYWILLVSILMPFLGVMGDFVFSGIKRNFGAKDFSNLIPGHGGVLDRIDSLIFVNCLVAGMITFIKFVGGI